MPNGIGIDFECDASLDLGEWCDLWLDGYGTRRGSTVRQAEVHVLRIKAAFGRMRLGALRPSHVKTWTAQLAAEGLSDSYVHALPRGWRSSTPMRSRMA